MRKFVVAALFAAGVAVLATAALGSTKSPSKAASAVRRDGHVRQDAHDRRRSPDHRACGRRSASSSSAGRSSTSSAGTRKRRTRRRRSRSSRATRSSASTRRSPSRSRKSFASNSKLLGVVGPAGSQEVVASTSAYKAGGLGFVTRAPRRARRSRTATPTATGAGSSSAWCRTTASQGPTVANYIDQEAEVRSGSTSSTTRRPTRRAWPTACRRILKARGVTRHPRLGQPGHDSDFSSLIAKIPGNTQVIYIPWQLAPQAQAFGQQLKAAGKGKIKLFGSDGLFAPGHLEDHRLVRLVLPGRLRPIRSSRRTPRRTSGDGEYFGAPSYVAAQVVVGAVTKACADGKATRAEVRKNDREDEAEELDPRLPGLVPGRAATCKAPASFGIYQIQSNGSFKRDRLDERI